MPIYDVYEFHEPVRKVLAIIAKGKVDTGCDPTTSFAKCSSQFLSIYFVYISFLPISLLLIFHISFIYIYSICNFLIE